MRRLGLAGRLPALILPLGGLLAWQLAIWIFSPRDWLLPSPGQVARVLVDDRAALWSDARATIAETLLGLAVAAVAGILLAVAISASRAFERSVYPWVVASQTIPILALAPLFVVWLDYGAAQVLVAALVTFFPIVVAGVDGLRAADPLMAASLRTLGASRLRAWREATLPAALPALFTGLKLAAVFSVTGAVVAEYVQSERGLGHLSQIASGNFDTALVFAAVLWLAAIGVVLFALVALTEWLVLPYRHRPAAPRWRSSVKHRLATVSTLALLALVVAGCGGGSDGATGSKGRHVESAKLLLDWYPNADHAGIFAAIDRGDLAKHGVRLSATVPANPATALRQVAQGRADFAISYQSETLIARSRGIPVVAVGALVQHPLNALIARADRGVARPRDLVGKTVGATGVPSDQVLVDAVVKADGGDPAKVELRSVGYSLAPALAAGKVDAIIGGYWNVEAVEVRRKGVPVKVFRLEQHGVPDYDELVVVTSDRTARERPTLVRSVLAGLAEGQRWAVDHRAQSIDLLARANKDLDRSLATTGLSLVAPLLVPPGGEPLAIDPAKWKRYASWMTGTHLLQRPVDASRAVTDRFLPGKS